MKKLFQPKTVSLIIVAALTFLTAQVALATEGIFENNLSGALNGGIVVIVGAGDDNTVNYCSRELIEYKAVVIRLDNHQTIRTTVAISSIAVVKPGDRFDISSEVGCGDQRVATDLTRIPDG